MMATFAVVYQQSRKKGIPHAVLFNGSLVTETRCNFFGYESELTWTSMVYKLLIINLTH